MPGISVNQCYCCCCYNYFYHYYDNGATKKGIVRESITEKIFRLTFADYAEVEQETKKEGHCRKRREQVQRYKTAQLLRRRMKQPE